MPHRISPRVLVLLALLTLVWGTNWPLFAIATREVSVWTFRAITLGAAGAVLLGLAHLRGLSLVVPRGQRLTLVAAAVAYLVVWNIASTYSALMIPSGQAALLGFTMPLWAALFTWALFREKLTGRLLLAMALGAVGVALLMWRSREAYAQAPLGVALGLLSGVGWAVGTLILKRRAIDVPVMVLAGWQIVWPPCPSPSVRCGWATTSGSCPRPPPGWSSPTSPWCRCAWATSPGSRSSACCRPTWPGCRRS